MTIQLKKKDKYEDELKFSTMLPFEYFVAEKRFDEPKTGAGVGSEGPFEWTLFGLTLYEYASIDPNTGEKFTEKFEEGVNVSTFKSAKSFVDRLAEIEVGKKFKVTQIPVEGKAYKTYVITLFDGSAPTPAVADTKPVTLVDKILQLKTAGVTLADALPLLAKEYESATPEMVTALWG